MDKLNKKVAKITTSILLVSAISTVHRYKNENSRRLGLKGNYIFQHDSTNSIEYNIHKSEESNKVIIFENGLGDPLEIWDYIKIYLADEYNLLFYNRPGYGYSKSDKNSVDILEKLYKKNFTDDKEIIFVAHSIGALITGQNISSSDYFQKNLKEVILIDGTEPELFDNYKDNPVQRGEFYQASVQKILAGIFGFQWWGLDKYARRTSFQPDIQQAVRLFNANPKEIISTINEYNSVNTKWLKEILESMPDKISIISSSEKKFQQFSLSKEYNLKYYHINGSLHHSIIASPVFARETANQIRNIIGK